jgi:hypothetical protein
MDDACRMNGGEEEHISVIGGIASQSERYHWEDQDILGWILLRQDRGN